MTPPATRSPDRYHHGDLRRALLAAARALLEERGPAALNLREIARRVGVSAPSAYHHFVNRDAIAVALAEQGFVELLEGLDAAPAGAERALAPAGQAYVAFARANPALYRLMFGEGFRIASDGGAAVRALRERAYDNAINSLRTRLPSEEAKIAFLFLWSLTHGLALLMIDGQIDLGADPDALISSVLRLAGSGVPPSA